MTIRRFVPCLNEWGNSIAGLPDVNNPIEIKSLDDFRNIQWIKFLFKCHTFESFSLNGNVIVANLANNHHMALALVDDEYLKEAENIFENA